MPGMLSVGQTLSSPVGQLLSKCPLAKLDQYRSYISSHSLFQRVTSNWKALLMDCGTAVAVAGCVIAFFMGSTLMCTAFLLTAIPCGVGAFYMRHFAALTGLQETAQGLREAKERLEGVASNLAAENDRLAASNNELQRNNTLFQQSNQTLIQTSTQLNQQVTHLALQVVHLRESTQRIRSELIRFHEENNHLHANVRGFDQSLRLFDQQIAGSQALGQQIAQHFASQQHGLGQQLEQLSTYLSELRADNRLQERIQNLAALQTQVMQAATQLHDIQRQYAVELTNFQAVHAALAQLRDQFDTTLRANNQQFGNHLATLTLERQRIHELLNRFSQVAPPASQMNYPMTAARAHQVAHAPPSALAI